MSPSPDRYRKQALFAGIGLAGQERIIASRAVVIGCGALGSVIAETLVRAGVGHVRLVDRDFVDLSNLQRQVLYDEQDVAERLPKAVAAARKLRRINSSIVVEEFVEDVRSRNVLELISGSNVILDGTDNFETRFLLNDAALETGIPWIHAGCVGSQGQVLAIVPGRTPCLRCLMPELPGPGASETCDTAGVIGPAVNVIASLQATLALQVLSGNLDLIRPELRVVDVWEGDWRSLNMSSLVGNSRCPSCGQGDRSWLRGDQGSQTTILCGRNSVQVAPPAGGERLDLSALAEKLRGSGAIRANPFLVIFQPAESPCELTIFNDGRAIISGTEDLALARSLYSRFIGA